MSSPQELLFCGFLISFVSVLLGMYFGFLLQIKECQENIKRWHECKSRFKPPGMDYFLAITRPNSNCKNLVYVIRDANGFYVTGDGTKVDILGCRTLFFETRDAALKYLMVDFKHTATVQCCDLSLLQMDKVDFN